MQLFKSYRDGVPDGGQKRDFVYVRDAADVVDWLTANAGRSTASSTWAPAQARTFEDMAARGVRRGRQDRRRSTTSPMPPAIRDKYQYFTEAKMDRLKAAGYDRAA